MPQQTPSQEQARLWQRIQKLVQERTWLATDGDTGMSSSERIDEINAEILQLEARYNELGTPLHGSYVSPDEDDEAPAAPPAPRTPL